MNKTSVSLITALLPVLFLCGCSQRTIVSAQRDTQHDIDTANQKANQLAAEAKPKIETVGDAARVTAAITVNENLKGSDIRVDTAPGGVRLRGTVVSAAQKRLAENVARQTLGTTKTVQDQLTVQAP